MKYSRMYIVWVCLSALTGAGCLTQSHLDRTIEKELAFSLNAVPMVTKNALGVVGRSFHGFVVREAAEGENGSTGFYRRA